MTQSRYESVKPSYQTVAKQGQPPMGSVAVFEWEPFKPLVDYSDSSLLAVFQRISRDIIERPYHYDAHRAFDNRGYRRNYTFTAATNHAPPAKVDGIAVYKRNHGTGHAIRQMIYTDALIDKIAVDGSPLGQQIAQQIAANAEIRSILKLAAYCKRIGRTLDNEHDNGGHTTIYSKRSADLFSRMVDELGYSKDLIAVIGTSMLEPRPEPAIDIESMNNIGAINAAALLDFSENILMAAHMADLARLFSVRREDILSQLWSYLPAEQFEPVTTVLVSMACQANLMTGNPVVQQERGVKHQTTYSDGTKLVAVVNHIDRAISDLSTLNLSPSDRAEQLAVRLTAHPAISNHASSSTPLSPLLPSGFSQHSPSVRPSPELNATIKTGYLTPNISQAPGHERSLPDVILSNSLIAQQQKLQSLLEQLLVKIVELELKARTSKAYQPVARELSQLHRVLFNEQKVFFAMPTARGLVEFKQRCTDAIDDVKTAKEHRGWHKVHPILRAIVGLLTVFAALIVQHTSKHGYVGTFFQTPKTDTAQKIADFKQQCNQTINDIDGIITNPATGKAGL